MVDFQQQSPQRLVDEYYGHMNSQNDRLDLFLKPLQRKYYFMKYGKSYVIHCKYACFHSLRLFSLYWSVAPSIFFNIKERDLAHCLLWSLGKIGLRRSIRRGITCRTDFK